MRTEELMCLLCKELEYLRSVREVGELRRGSPIPRNLPSAPTHESAPNSRSTEVTIRTPDGPKAHGIVKGTKEANESFERIEFPSSPCT